MKARKFLLCLLVTACAAAALFAQDADDDFDFDDIFEDAQDADEPVQSEPATTALMDSMLFKSLTVTGTLNSDIGGYYNYSEDDGHDGGGAFSLENYLYLFARASKELSLHGSIYTAISTQFDIKLDTLYFDYLLGDILYITAGKRSISWGYPRLFGNSDLYGSGTNDYGLPLAGLLYTDILEVSNNHVICQFRLPWTSGCFSAMALYDFDRITSNASYKYLSGAASLEFTFWHISTNFFGRIYGKGEAQSGDEDDPDLHPIIGLEMKRTIFGTDFYGQALARFKSNADEFSTDMIDYVVGTAGFYKYWDTVPPDFGINIEYQGVYDPHYLTSNYEESKITHKIAVEAGIKRLGHDRNLKFGLDWGHNFTEESGTLAVAFYISNIFRYATLKTVAGMSYDHDWKSPKVMVATVLSISMSY